MELGYYMCNMFLCVANFDYLEFTVAASDVVLYHSPKKCEND
jgi:hypothetical protein